MEKRFRTKIDPAFMAGAMRNPARTETVAWALGLQAAVYRTVRSLPGGLKLSGRELKRFCDSFYQANHVAVTAFGEHLAAGEVLTARVVFSRNNVGFATLVISHMVDREETLEVTFVVEARACVEAGATFPEDDKPTLLRLDQMPDGPFGRKVEP